MASQVQAEPLLELLRERVLQPRLSQGRVQELVLLVRVELPRPVLPPVQVLVQVQQGHSVQVWGKQQIQRLQWWRSSPLQEPSVPL